MKNYFTIIIILFSAFLSAQNVALTRVDRLHENTDKRLYRIHTSENAIYLGDVEIQGYSENDAEVFGAIYKKAKEIGANGFMPKEIESVDGTFQPFDSRNYQLQLYYTAAENFPVEENTVYLFSASPKQQTIRFQNQNIVLPPRSYIKTVLQPGVVYQLSTRKILGASVRLAASSQQPVQYFQVSSFRIKPDQSGITGGLNVRTGDIIQLERSFADFLTVLYQEQTANN